ncbi:hypothetical protein GO730_06650 [Spirosoma sp. HMF3257]|uniref:Ig-like domain-containing protein n=1 Tax=Spirosoma telluris TaxID=2183553 RepID=A0A327NJA8_9BACT|nr:hypothetical protein [Spirosoma telluris]RAI74096.1 hypothetical protein HMF3257_06590 [Spirosoma telluris]
MGSAFSQTFTVSNGTDPSTFTLLSGSLPTGLTLASTGVLSGTPTQSGTFTLVVQGTDAGGCMNTGSTYTLTVGGLPPTLSGFAPTVSTVCTGQITTFTAIIGNVTGSYDFTLTNGTSTTTGTTSNTAFSQSWTAGGYGVQSFSLIISTNGSFATASTTLTVGAVISNAAINYWGGCISSDWQTASNWSKGHVPTASEDVALLASAPNQPILSSAGVANSVDVPASTTLTIGNSGNLTINGSGTANTGLRVTGTFQNSGQLTIDGTTTYGLLNVPGAPGGTVANSGTITVGSSASAGSYGVYNLSNFTNNSGGLIRIDRADEGLTNNNSGTFTNAGAITIGASALIGQFGLKNLSTFNNIAGSSIAIDRVGNTGLYNALPATFTNSSSITIGASASIGSYGLYNSAGGRFNNATGGQISITNSLSAGLYNTTSSIFSNSAVVTIGASGRAGQYGLHNAAGNFINTADGQVSINRASITGLYNSTGSGTITNSGTIAIGNLASVGQYGISSNGLFSNTTGGLVQIDNTSLAGYFNSSSSGSKVYNSGTLTIGASVSVGQYGIRNENIFDNELGGQIRIDRSTGTGLYTTGTFSNSANITIGASASVGQYGLQNIGTFTNSAKGQINIDNSSSVGLAHLAPSQFFPFTNSGTITIGANAAVGSIALSVSQLNTVFTNNAGGLITLARSTTVGLGNYLSTINNAGTIRVGTIAGVGQYGLQNELAYFNNLAGGIIYLDGTTDTGLLNKHGAFTNSSTILIGSISSVGATGVSNETALLNNSGCAALLKVVSDAVITNSASGTFTNTGTIIENAGGNSSISSNAGLVLNQNDGIFTTGTGPNTPLSITGTAPTVCSPANGSFTLTGLQANTTYSLSYTLNGTPTTVSPDPVSDANGQFTLSGLSGGVYIFSLSGSCVAEALPLSATLTSPEQLTITTQPAAMSVVCAGVSVYASIGLSGTSTSYQWYKDGVSLGISQTAVTLSLTNVQISDAGNYSVVATGDCNSATSTAFSLTVNLAPSLTVTANPSLTITSGNTVTLTVSGGINYTWTGNVQSATFTASPIITTTYSVTGNTSGCTSATSVTVTVNSATPTTMGFTGLATSVCSGNPVTFTATVGNVTGSYDYTLTNGSNSVNGSSNSTTFSQNWITSGSGLQTFTLTVNDNGASTTALTTLTVNALPSAAILTPTSTTLTCTTPSLSLTATGEVLTNGKTIAQVPPGLSVYQALIPSPLPRLVVPLRPVS